MSDTAKKCAKGYQYYSDNPRQTIHPAYCEECIFRAFCSVRKKVVAGEKAMQLQALSRKRTK
jgi:hypothetical protein